MTTRDMIDYCLNKNGAYEDQPFGPDVLVIKVRKKIFAQFFTLKGHECATLNCDMMSGQFYRGLYPDVITRGYHCPPVQQPYFNTFCLDAGLPDSLITEMMDNSYATVVGKLPKYVQRELAEFEEQ